MRFAVLGPLEVHDDAGAPAPLTSKKQRLLLAVLLSHANRVVSTDLLVDAMWHGSPPRSAPAGLQVYVHRLRRLLGEDRIRYHHPGYRIVVAPGELDAERVVALAATGDIAGALALWRGEAYAGLADVPVLREEAARLAELRLSIMEDRVEADLAGGNHAALVHELAALVDRHPLRERPRAQLMLALYRSGRPAEALDAYRAARKTIVDELGVEPGPRLRELHAAILREDPTLDLAAPPVVAPQPVPAELPPATSTFTGRGADLDRIARLLAAPGGGVVPIVAIDGPAGIGKSAVAFQAAHAVSSGYPDGQLHVNLRGATPGMAPLSPGAVLRRFLRALGEPDARLPDDLDERAARFRSLTAGRRLLVVLDDAATAEQVRPLLPGGGAVLVTSRIPLVSLDGAAHLRLGELPVDEAVLLLSRLAGDDRIAAQPDDAREITRLCGGLPLAVRIAGARLAARPGWPLAALVRSLGGSQDRLDALEHADLGVRASFAVSHRDLPAGAARLFALLGALSLPDVTVPVVAALAGDRVGRDLDRLVEAQLVTVDGDDRYSLHDLIRLYARERAAELAEAERTEAVRRVLHCYLATARTAMARLDPESRDPLTVGVPPDAQIQPGVEVPDRASAAAWVTAECDNLVALGRLAVAMPGEGTVALYSIASALARPFEMLGRIGERIALNELLLAACGTDPRVEETRVRYDLGVAYRMTGRLDESLAHLTGALECWRRTGPAYLEAPILTALGIVTRVMGRLDEAVAYTEQALEVCRAQGRRRNETALLNSLGLIRRQQERHDEAIALHERCVALADELGDDHLGGGMLTNLAEGHRLAGRPALAATLFERALGKARTAAASRMQAEALWFLGRALHDLGRAAEGRDRHREALAILRDMRLITPAESAALLAQPVPVTPDPIRYF